MTKAPLPERLRAFRSRAIREGRRMYRPRLPLDVGDRASRPSFDNLPDALNYAREQGATSCQVYEFAVLDGAPVHLACREWLLGWRLVPPAPAPSGGAGGL